MMLITHRYEYKSLERVTTPGGRRYIVGEDRALPSVTTILSKTKDMTHLIKWRQNVGEAEAQRIVTEAAGIGNSMHNNLEKYILGEPMSGAPMGQILAKLIIKEGLCNVNEIWGSEVGLFSSGLYAGTTDIVGLHNGTPAIMDFKNSRKDKKREWIEDYFMQLAAYALSHNEMYNTNINKGVVMVATRDAKYQEFVIEGDEFTKYETMWANKVCAYYEQYGQS
jgi:hypothetical protein